MAEMNSVQGSSNQSKTILIVDDNADAAEALAESLRIFGHEVHLAHNGLSGIQQAQALRPEVMILDIGMPDMSGYEVARSIRLTAGGQSPMLIALTGYTEESDRMIAEEAGFKYHFAKPLDMKRLATVLNQSGTVHP